jgi:hypothetical protein
MRLVVRAAHHGWPVGRDQGYKKIKTKQMIGFPAAIH